MLIGLTIVLNFFIDLSLTTNQRQDRPVYRYRAFAENPQPCDDYYAHACESKYKKSVKAVGSSSSSSTTIDFKSLVFEAQDDLIGKLKAIVNGDVVVDEDTDGGPIKLMRRFYESCMDTDIIDNSGVKPLSKILNNLGGWPLISPTSTIDNYTDWRDLHDFYNKIDAPAFYEVTVNSDPFRRSRTILLRQPKLIVRRDLLQKPKIFYEYVDFIKTVATILAAVESTYGNTVNEEDLFIGAKQIAAFEAELGTILEIPEDTELYRPLMLRKFQNITDQLAKNHNYTLNWMKIINDMQSTRFITNDDVIDVTAIGYFTKLMRLLQRTSLRTLINYVHWRFVIQFVPFTSNDLRNIYFGMMNFMHEPVKNVTRWKLCGFEPAFDHVMSFVFAKKFITSEIENSTNEILSDIKETTVKTIRKSLLLNNDEKERAESKVSTMNFILGVSESLKNFSYVINYYENLSITENYFENLLKLRKFYKIKEFEAVDKTHLTPASNDNFSKITIVSSIGSAYEFFQNRVLIKAENFMAPLFDPRYPEYKKYGILGFTIAYEIMHAFNEADSIGNERSRKRLYSEQTRQNYWRKLECFIDQYDSYQIPHPFSPERSLHVDGERSAMENVADSTAIRIALLAYRERSKSQIYHSLIEEKKNDENFFASFTSLLCRPELESFYLSRFNFALRTLPRFRVIGSLANTEDFARAHDCTNETLMNPAVRCNFWD